VAWTRWVRVLTFVHLVAMLAGAMLVAVTGDRTGLGMLVLFAPRHWLLILSVLLLPIAAAVSVRTGLVAVVALLLALFPIAMLEVPVPWRPRAADPVLRLVTWNTDRSRQVAWRLRDDLQRWDADVVLLQDCKTETADSVRALRGVRTWTSPEFCVISRLPIDSIRELPSRDDLPGRFGRALRLQVQHAGRQLAIYSVHLESPRDALWAALHLDFSKLAPNIEWRGLDSHRIASWLSPADSSAIVAGDFNLPAGSAILRRDWGRFRNAFSDAGFGLGHTMFAGRHAIRIDHVLLTPSLAARSARVLRGYPAEHQPVLVEVGWKR
jgi:endonuclease/exonuclease/phosphatase (EEP) superfamily protein YafD